MEAEALYREAIGIWKKNYGEDEPLVASGLNHLAGLLKNQVFSFHHFSLHNAGDC